MGSPERRAAAAREKMRSPQKANLEANLESPLSLSDLDTPNSTSSLIWSVSPTPLEDLSVLTSRLAVENMPRDIKKRPITPDVSQKSMAVGVQKAFHASKRLQRVVGLQTAVPFVCPPAMPHDLLEAYVMGLGEYGTERAEVTSTLKLPTRLEGHEVDLIDGQSELNPQLSSEAPVLFPSPIPTTPSTITPEAQNDFFTTLFQQPPAPSSPPKLGKRTRSPKEQRGKKQRNEDIVGLPSLPLAVSGAWESEFPGNTEGLFQILTTWHTTMQTLFSQVSDPQIMAIHPMFPYQPTEPVEVPLMSCTLYTTETEPHKEFRFIWEGDVEVLTYNEVDVFATLEEIASDEAKSKEGDGTEHLESMLNQGNSTSKKDVRNRDMRARAQTGEGRWCFIYIRGFPSKELSTEMEGERDVAPYVIIGFHVSAITRKVTKESGTMIHFDAAGSIPLIEGFGTDLHTWRPFLDAVGMGKGKIVMVSKTE